MKTTTVDLPKRTFVEKAGVTLAEAQLVSGETDGTVKPAVAGKVLGVFAGRLTPGLKDVGVFIYGQTVRVRQEAAIAVFADVSQGTDPLKVKTLVAGGKILGTKVYPAASGAAGDIIEVVLAGSGSNAGGALNLTPQTATHGNVDGAVAALSSTAVNPTKADFDGMKAAVETIADDLRSLRAALIAMGLPLTEV